ncbi:MAG: FIST C-terminal domain-containing protein [Pseudomonadota bacterium]
MALDLQLGAMAPGGAFVCAQVSDPLWQKAADRCAETVQASGLSPALGFVYVSDLHGPRFPSIVARLRERTGIEHWVGATGLGVCATGREYFDEPAICLLAGTFPGGGFHVFGDSPEGDASSLLRAGDTDANIAVVHGDPGDPGIVDRIQGLARRVSSGFVVGGLASGRGEPVRWADGAAAGGLSGVLLGESVPVLTRISHGCVPVGPKRVVTECHRNVIMKLDDLPALEAFDRDAGHRHGGDYRRAAAELFAGLVVGGGRGSELLVRNLVGVDPQQQWLAIGDQVEPGTELMFCRRDAQSAREAMVRMLTDARDAIGGTPRGGLYFSCLGRGESLFGTESGELALIARHLGEFPLAGFFGNGEVSHDRLYGYTGVLMLFA